MLEKLQSFNTKTSHQDNTKQKRIQSSKHYRSHTNLIKSNQAESETQRFQNNQIREFITSFFNQDLLFQQNKISQFEGQFLSNGKIDYNQTFIIILKEQIKKLELDLLDKIKELEQYKKLSKVTVLQELQVELYNYQQLVLIQKQEIIQLKEQIRDEQEFTIEDLYQLQEKKIQSLLTQNQEFKIENAKYKTQNYFHFQQVESLNVRLNIKEKEICKLTNLVKQLEDKIKNNCYIPKTRQQIFKESVENANLLEQLQQLQMKYQEHVNSQQQDIDSLKKQLNIVEEEKNRLQQLLQSLQSKRNSSVEIPQVQSQQSPNRNLNKLQSQLDCQQQLQKQNFQLGQQSSQNQTQNIQQIDITKLQKQELRDNIVDSNNQAQFSNRKDKKIIRVNFYEVQQLGMEIRFKLLSKEIQFQKIEDLFSKFDIQVKIHELLDMLLQEPFKIQSYEQRKLIARYLIEDNNEDYIVYDALRSNKTYIVLSIFKQLIGKYQLFQKHEIFQIENELKLIFEKIQYSLNNAVQQLTNKKKYLKPGQCERLDYELAIKNTEINLTPRQLEYIYFLNYTFYQDLSIIYYQNVMTYFNKSK